MIAHHRNQGGEKDDVGPLNENMARLVEAGFRPFVTVIGEGGHAAQLLDMGCEVAFANDNWRGAPAYDSGNPAGDAAARWATIKAAWPPELSKEAWVIVLNEPDKERARYVFRFILELTRLANADGYRVCGPNWSTGTPEVAEWETPEGLAWLRYCGEHPDIAACAVHEYSLDTANIRTAYPWLVGRHQFVDFLCDEYDIPRPRWLVCEMGWSYENMPDTATALAQLTQPDGDEPAIVDLYDDAALWTLGGWKNGPGLPPKLAQLITPLTDWILANREPPEPEPEPEPDPVDWRRAVWEASLEEQQARGITLNPTHGLEKLIYAREGYQVVHREITHRLTDGTAYGLMAAEHLGGEEPRIVLAFKRPWSGAANVEVLTEADVPEPEPLPFAWRAWPTDYRVITQTAGNNPAYYGKIAPDFEGHEGLDIRAPMGAPVYSVDAGIVSDMRQLGDAGHPYGRFVRVRHEGGFESTYAHLNSIAVGVGEPVEAGQVIAHADNTGNIVSGSSHLHVTLKKDGVIVDPTPFILPWKPNFPGLPPAAHGITICDVSHHQGAIDFHKMLRRGAHACYIRGSIGGTGMDTRFVANWNAIAQTTLARGMYHLFRSDSTARRNLDNILRVVDLHGAGDLRIALDIEPVTNLPRIDGDKVTELIGMFEAELGYSPLIYTGLWVLDRTDGDRSWFLHPHLWLASYWQSPPQMNQFPQLPIGSELSKLVAHQFTSSYYDGRAWGTQSIGLDVNIVYDLDRLLVTGDAPEPPPPAPTIDMAQFFLPLPGNFGDIVILKNNWGEGDERQQLQRDGSTAYVTKNQQWERRRIGDATINLDLDTSPGNNRYYTVETTTGWMPRHWRPGETFTRVETARFFNKGDCSQTGETLSGTSNLLFARLHNLYTTRGGITFQNVAEIHWIRNGVTEEQYFYGGDGYGLIAWKNRGGRESWATEVIPVGQQENNTREEGCWT